VPVLTDETVVVASPAAGLVEAIDRKLLIIEPSKESAALVGQERENLLRMLEQRGS
jgi:hypothetical protein